MFAMHASEAEKETQNGSSWGWGGKEPHRYFTLTVNCDYLVNKLGAAGQGLKNDL